MNLLGKSGFTAVCLLCIVGMSGCSIRLASSVTTAPPTAVVTEVPASLLPTPAPTPDLRFFVSVKVTGPEGELFSESEFETEEGATVFSVLQEICEKKGVKLDYSGSVRRGTVYVEGIDGAYEKMYGGSSGWTYYVNGTMPNASVSSYKVNNRDVIEWRYVK